MFSCATGSLKRIFLTFSAMAMVSCLSTHSGNEPRTIPTAISHDHYVLTYDEEFDSLDLGLNGQGTHDWYAGLWWEKIPTSRDEIKLQNSVLHLEWRENTGATKKWTTSINSAPYDFKSGHLWQYGYYEIKMKWNVAPGAWPALWLVAPDLITNEKKGKGCEIDIFEGQAAFPKTFFGTVHQWQDGKSTQNKNNSAMIDTNFEDFHVYGLLWTPQKVSWYFDNKKVLEEKTPPLCEQGPLFLILTSSEGVKWKYGNMDGVPDAVSLYMDVDWVRVWQER